MFGFLLQWPTILTLAMFPVLTVMYVKLARGEERDARAKFETSMSDMRPMCRDLFEVEPGLWHRVQWWISAWLAGGRSALCSEASGWPVA